MAGSTGPVEAAWEQATSCVRISSSGIESARAEAGQGTILCYRHTHAPHVVAPGELRILQVDHIRPASAQYRDSDGGHEHDDRHGGQGHPAWQAKEHEHRCGQPPGEVSSSTQGDDHESGAQETAGEEQPSLAPCHSRAVEERRQ